MAGDMPKLIYSCSGIDLLLELTCHEGSVGNFGLRNIHIHSFLEAVFLLLNLPPGGVGGG